MERILVAERDDIATITLHAPDNGNAVDVVMLEELKQVLADLTPREHLRALLLHGAGQDFCRGRIPPEQGTPSALQVRHTLDGIIAVNQLLRSFPVPTIAAVEGRALGFGCGLAILCDITIVGQGARLGFPELLRDLPPTIVMSYLGRLIPRKKALELVLTGKDISVTEAATLGLINRVVETEQAYPEALALATTLAERDPLAVRTCRQFFREAQRMDEDTAAQYGINVLSTILSSRRRS